MDYSFITKSFEYKNYISVSNEIKKYFKENMCEPAELSKRYKSALNSYRDLLNSHCVNMPSALYPFDKEDKKTWKYINCKLNGENYKGAVHNPNWIYK